MVTQYIGADVHVATTELAVDRGGRIVGRHRIAASITAFREVLEQIPRPKVLIVEEGCMSGWLYRNLHQDVDRMLVCDPRRNHYIAKDGDKDDRIDAEKLAALGRGGYLREVYHSVDESRVAFKEWVGIYHDRVRERTRQTNKIYAVARVRGVVIPRSALSAEAWPAWLQRQADPELRQQLAVLWEGRAVVQWQVGQALREVRRRRRAYPILHYWEELPGVGPVRSSTLFAYLDTPWRFGKPNKLWKYCGLGLQRSASGTDRRGRPRPGTLRLAWQVNKRLKDAIMGAATNAIAGDNPFGTIYRRLIHDGLTPGNAKHTVARKLLTVMWGMWKRNQPFDPQWLSREPSARRR